MIGQIDLFLVFLLIIISASIAGVLAGLLGVGGGIIIVPLLYYVMNLLEYDQSIIMHTAVGTSLFIIIPTSIRSSIEHRIRGSFDKEVFKSWMVPIAVGSGLGSVAASYSSFKVLTLLFAGIASFVSIQMFIGTKTKEQNINIPKSLFQISPLFIGLLSAMMGIGGGTLSVPIINYSGIDIKKAVGTSAAIGMVIAIPGSLGFMLGGLNQSELLPPFSIGYVNWLAFLLIVPITLITVPYGVKLAHRSSQKGLRKLFGIFLGLTALKMFSDLI